MLAASIQPKKRCLLQVFYNLLGIVPLCIIAIQYFLPVQNHIQQTYQTFSCRTSYNMCRSVFIRPSSSIYIFVATCSVWNAVILHSSLRMWNIDMSYTHFLVLLSYVLELEYSIPFQIFATVFNASKLYLDIKTVRYCSTIMFPPLRHLLLLWMEALDKISTL